MKKYYDKQTNTIITIEEAEKEYNEIIHNSSYDEETIGLIGNFEDFLKEFYEEVEE